jgi:hypothetical protein
VTGIVIAILIGYVGPVKGYLDQRAELTNQQQVLQGLEAERARVKDQISRLRQPAVLEVRARELQLARRGERIYIVKGLPPPPPASPPEPEGRGILERIAGLF